MGDLVSRESIRKNIKQRLMETALNTCGEETTMDEACVDIHDNRIDTWINEVSPISCNATTEEIAQSFIEDVEAVKEHLPCCCQMEFPATFEEYAKDYGLIDDKEIYTNGSHLIPVFRVQQWLEHLEQPTSDDCVSRAEVLKGSVEVRRLDGVEVYSDKVVPIEYVKSLPSVTPTYHKSATNGEEIIRAFPDLKYTIQNGRVVTTIGVASSFDLDWWNAPYKRGNENDTKTSYKGI